MLENAKYRIVNIILLDSQFKRSQVIDYKSPSLKNNISIETNKGIDKNKLTVNLTLKFDVTIEENQVIMAQVTMAGIFECTENPELSIDTFGKVNAPAIIFPFIREHIASLSLKAGIVPIILPPVNFVQLAEEKITEEIKNH